MAVATHHLCDVLRHLDGPEQGWPGGAVDATVGKSGVNVYSCVTDSRLIGEEDRPQNGTTAAHSGHASEAEARLQVMPAIRAGGCGGSLTARAGLQDVFAD